MLDQVSPRRGALELYIDAGPLARDIGYALGRVRLPEIPLVLTALVRVMEYAFVARTTAVIAPDLEWLAYVYLVVIAFHHTDTVARMRHLGRGPARWVYTAGLGYDGRMLVLAALALTGPEAYRRGLPIVVGLLAVVYI